MNKLKCIDNNGYKLTVGSEYNMITEDREFYFLINDSNRTVRYNKRLFELVSEETLVVAAPVVRTEQDMINSIVYDDTQLFYNDLNNQTVRLSLDLEIDNTEISCGIGQISGINNVFGEITEMVPEDDDYIGLQKALLTAFLNGYVKSNTDKAIWLISTTTGMDEDLLSVMDEVSDFVTETKRNPNSGNDIKMWGFYTN